MTNSTGIRHTMTAVMTQPKITAAIDKFLLMALISPERIWPSETWPMIAPTGGRKIARTNAQIGKLLSLPNSFG